MIKALQNALEKYFFNLGLSQELGSVDLSPMKGVDFQCNGAFKAAKILKTNPLKLANEVISSLHSSFPHFSFSVAGGGFININLNDESVLELAKKSLDISPEEKKVVIDFGSPNVAKGMHVGHLRSALIGAALVNIHRAKSHAVTGDNHLGDWGTPIGIVICKIKNKENFSWTLENIEKEYVAGSLEYKDETNLQFKNEVQETTKKLQSGDSQTKELWEKLVATTIQSLKVDYGALGVSFDLWLGESHFEALIPPMIKELKEKGLAQEHEGAVVVPLENSPSLILEKSNGAYLYHTTDLACIKERAQNYEQILYVVDKRQSLHFKQVFEVATQVGYLKPSIQAEHVAFGTINGSDGKPYKTRDGGVLKLKELIALMQEAADKKLTSLGVNYSEVEKEEIIKKVGIGALKFAELKHNRESDYAFDLEKFISLEGFTGPYVMYAAVRAKSVMNKASNVPQAKLHAMSESERNLLMEMSKFSFYFNLALEKNEPHHLCQFAYNVAQAFNNFYHHTKILSNEDKELAAHYLWVTEQSF